MITDRDINLLRSCANWLDTRSNAAIFKFHNHLMREYAAGLNRIADDLSTTATANPVTRSEMFGKR